MLARGVSAGSRASVTCRGPVVGPLGDLDLAGSARDRVEVLLEEVGGAPVGLGGRHAGRLVGEPLERPARPGHRGAQGLAQAAAGLGERALLLEPPVVGLDGGRERESGAPATGAKRGASAVPLPRLRGQVRAARQRAPGAARGSGPPWPGRRRRRRRGGGFRSARSARRRATPGRRHARNAAPPADPRRGPRWRRGGRRPARGAARTWKASGSGWDGRPPGGGVDAGEVRLGGEEQGRVAGRTAQLEGDEPLGVDPHRVDARPGQRCQLRDEERDLAGAQGHGCPKRLRPPGGGRKTRRELPRATKASLLLLGLLRSLLLRRSLLHSLLLGSHVLPP